MSAISVTEGDVLYLSFYLKDKDPVTGSITYHDISGASSIVFRMRKYYSSSNTIETTMEVVTGTLGYCRVLVTIPTEGTFSSEVEVFEAGQNITWEGPVYVVRGELG